MRLVGHTPIPEKKNIDTNDNTMHATAVDRVNAESNNGLPLPRTHAHARARTATRTHTVAHARLLTRLDGRVSYTGGVRGNRRRRRLPWRARHHASRRQSHKTAGRPSTADRIREHPTSDNDHRVNSNRLDGLCFWYKSRLGDNSQAAAGMVHVLVTDRIMIFWRQPFLMREKVETASKIT